MEFNVADLIERVAKHIPNREALVCGERRATYQDLNQHAQQFAVYLMSIGLGKNDHIAIYAYNCIEWAEVLLACYKIGAVPININYRYVEEELHYIFNNADIKAVIYEAQFTERLKNIIPRLPKMQHFIHLDQDNDVVAGSIYYQQALAIDSASVTFPIRRGDDLYVLYTGGTTGMPKGVVWRQHDIIMALGGGIDMTTQEAIATPELMADRCIKENAFYMRSMQLAPLMHGAAQWGLLRALFEGHTVLMLASKSFDADEVWRMIEREQVNTVLLTGDAMARPMMDALLKSSEGGKPGFNTSSLFVFASSAAVFSPSLKDKYTDVLPNVLIMDNIGSTESGYTGAAVHQKGKADSNAGGPRVSPGRDVVVLDENYTLLQPGSEKQGFLAKGGFIPSAYYKDEKKSAATFITGADGKRYVIPGDMAIYNADGSITMLGRGSLCINSGGEKIFPEEVEVAIKAHEAVYDCLVVGTPDERFGSAVTALIQLAKGFAEPDLKSIHAACASHIARYKVPKRVYIVDKVKRAPSGKPDYQWAKQEAMRRFVGEK